MMSTRMMDMRDYQSMGPKKVPVFIVPLSAEKVGSEGCRYEILQTSGAPATVGTIFRSDSASLKVRGSLKMTMIKLTNRVLAYSLSRWGMRGPQHHCIKKSLMFLSASIFLVMSERHFFEEHSGFRDPHNDLLVSSSCKILSWSRACDWGIVMSPLKSLILNYEKFKEDSHDNWRNRKIYECKKTWTMKYQGRMIGLIVIEICKTTANRSVACVSGEVELALKSWAISALRQYTSLFKKCVLKSECFRYSLFLSVSVAAVTVFIAHECLYNVIYLSQIREL